MLFRSAVALAVAAFAFGASAQSITLGAAVSQSGKYSANGKYTMNGYDIIVDTINAKGGIKVGDTTYKLKIKYYDDESTPARGAELAERLISQDGIKFLLGPYSSGLTKAIAPVTERNGVPMVEGNGASRSLFTNGYKYLFGVLSTSEQYLAPAIEMAADEAKAEGRDPSSLKIALAIQNDPFSQDIRAGVMADAAKYGMKIIIDDQLPKNLTDMTPTLIKVRALKPDLLVVSGHSKGAATAIRQINEQKIYVPMLAMTQCGSADIIGKFGKGAEDTLCATQWAPSLTYSDALMGSLLRDRAADQVANVAHLRGIVKASYAMPDIHWGYGFPIGGVAATTVEDGVVSPGGVGFDICCGVRLIASRFTEEDFNARRDMIMSELDRRIPRGIGKGGIAPGSLIMDILRRGAAAALANGYGWEGDLERCEEQGTSKGADPSVVSDRAVTRGKDQIGSLGAGNHFLEIQVVDEIHDDAAAEAFGLAHGMVVVMIHCGSRGMGHQTCTDQLRLMGDAMHRYGIVVPDRHLACVPVRSQEGEQYLGAMAAASNFAWANRHILAHEAREAFATAMGMTPEATDMHLVFDVAHNLAKIETHEVDGRTTSLCVHRKGATRAFGPGHPDLPPDLRSSGQPVLVPGSMGTASWVLKGGENNPAFGSAAHGAGRLMSRKKAKGKQSGGEVQRRLEEAGISIRPGSVSLLSEEAPYAYKDVDAVVDVCELANLATKVARLRPLGVVKG